MKITQEQAAADAPVFMRDRVYNRVETFGRAPLVAPSGISPVPLPAAWPLVAGWVGRRAGLGHLALLLLAGLAALNLLALAPLS